MRISLHYFASHIDAAILPDLELVTRYKEQLSAAFASSKIPCFWPPRSSSKSRSVSSRWCIPGRRPMIALSLLAKAVLRCGILLQVRGDVGQVVEHLCDTSERYDGVIDREIEDVELARLHLQVAPQRLTQK